MTLADLLKEMIDLPDQEVWENERILTPVRVFGVRLHSTGLSLREVVAVLDLLGVDRSHGAVWNWTHDLAETQSDPPTVEPSRVAIDEKQIKVDGEAKWLYAAIDTDSKCILDIDVHSRGETDTAAAFLRRLTEVHERNDAEFLVDAMGYLTALARHNLSGHLDYNDRNYIEKWFQTVTMRIDRFHFIWMGSSTSARRWLNRFKYHYNRQRPNQSLDGRTPAEEVPNYIVPKNLNTFQLVRSNIIMSNSPSPPTFTRTLPLFTDEDRDVLQRILHHAVEDFAYDHPDRKIARDLYHKIREGEAFRMGVAESFDQSILLVNPQIADVSTDRIINRFVSEMSSHDGEWQQIADELEHWWSKNESIHDDCVIGFEYSH